MVVLRRVGKAFVRLPGTVVLQFNLNRATGVGTGHGITGRQGEYRRSVTGRKITDVLGTGTVGVMCPSACQGILVAGTAVVFILMEPGSQMPAADAADAWPCCCCNNDEEEERKWGRKGL